LPFVENGVKTISIMTFSMTTLSIIIILSIATLSIMILNITTLSKVITMQYSVKHSSSIVIMLSVIFFVVMLDVVLPRVIAPLKMEWNQQEQRSYSGYLTALVHRERKN